MSIEKRTYETRAVREIASLLDERNRVLAVGPTGCGKTVIAALLIRKLSTARVLFLAHKYELIDQAYRRLMDTGIKAGIWMAHEESLHGNERVDLSARVQVASVQTASRRGVPGEFDLIVLDEAHRSLAETYQRIVKRHPRAKVLGLTATPCRADGQGLGSFFDEMYIIAKPSDLYADGYLAKPRAFAAPPRAIAELASRLVRVKTTAGDFNKKQLAKVVDNEWLMGSVVAESLRLAPSVPKVVFAASVKQSKKIAARFARKGISAAHVDGETLAADRVRILDDLKAGRVEVVCNVDVLSEGWDLPALGAVVIARPTKSKGLFIQMCGRAQRPYKGRTPKILDHGNNVRRLGILPSDDIEWSLEHGAGERKAQRIYYACPNCYTFAPTTVAACPECGEPRPIDEKERRLKEQQARLEEITQSRIADIRARVEKVAQEKNAPHGWVEKVMSEMTSWKYDVFGARSLMGRTAF